MARCTHPPDVDGDHDGFSGAQGDCNDCDPNVNPGAYDVPGNGIDEDCDGTPDDEPAGCDIGLAIDSTDALAAATSLGICRRQAGKSWGLVSAAWVLPDGTSTSIPTLPACPQNLPPNPLSHGLLPSFGKNVTPRDGKSMVAISSGIARAGLQNVPPPGFGQSPVNGAMCTESLTPVGFPKDSPSCPNIVAKGGKVYDGMALEVQLKVPTNADGLTFDFDFFSTEFPQSVCSFSGYNDQFVALLWSSATSTPSDHDISFDSMNNSVNVNSAFVQVCAPTTAGGKTFACPLGTNQLDGTGMTTVTADGGVAYDQGGATGWLITRADVVRGETIALRFAIWDAGDNILDSTALIDHLSWRFTSSTASSPPVAPPITTPLL